MALQITKQKDGKNITYWDIVQLYFNNDEKHLVAELRGYENKAKRDEAKTGAKTAEVIHRFSMSGADYPNTNKANFIKDIFSFIKKSPLYGGWSNAIEL